MTAVSVGEHKTVCPVRTDYLTSVAQINQDRVGTNRSDPANWRDTGPAPAYNCRDMGPWEHCQWSQLASDNWTLANAVK